MRFLYASTFDARALNQASRSGHLIPRALEAAGHDVDYLGPLSAPRRTIDKFVARIEHRLWPGLRLLEREPARLRRIGVRVDAEIEALTSRGRVPDAVLSFGTLTQAYGRWQGPRVIWSDCTLESMIGYFPGFTGLSKRALRHARDAERRAFDRAAVLAFPTTWAAESVIRDYRVEPARVHLLPFGPSLDVPSSQVELIRRARERDIEPWRLLWIGAEWTRKGGPMALETAEALGRRGHRVQLTLVGEPPPTQAALPPNVRVVGRIARGTPEGLAMLRSAYESHHVLLLPTKADCAPIVMRDAMAFAMPMVVSATGGVPSMLDDGIEGRRVPIDAEPAQWAEAVESILLDASRFATFQRSSRARHEREWNWPRSVDLLARALQRIR